MSTDLLTEQTESVTQGMKPSLRDRIARIMRVSPKMGIPVRPTTLDEDPMLRMSARVTMSNSVYGARFNMRRMTAERDPEFTPARVPPKPDTAMLEVMKLDTELPTGRVALALEAEELLGYSPLRKALNAPSPLARRLAALEIDVYDLKTVEAYKNMMLAHHQASEDNKVSEANPSWMGAYMVRSVEWQLVDLNTYGKAVPEYVLAKCMQIKRAIPEATFVVDELVERWSTLDPFMICKVANDEVYFEVWDEPKFEA